VHFWPDIVVITAASDELDEEAGSSDLDEEAGSSSLELEEEEVSGEVEELSDAAGGSYLHREAAFSSTGFLRLNVPVVDENDAT
jgi:hypothetical protein